MLNSVQIGNNVRQRTFTVPLPPDLLTLAQAARELGCTPDALRHAVQRGELPADKAGKTWFVLRADAVAWSNRPKKKTGRPRKGKSSIS